LARAGHTEGSVDLMKIAGLKGAAVICEVMRPDGEMARLPELQAFSRHFDIPLLTIAEIAAHRIATEALVEEVGCATLPIHHATSALEVRAFRSLVGGGEHLAVLNGPLGPGALVRVHSECLTGDVLGSLRCDCGAQLEAALGLIGRRRNSALVYLRGHEGRGIGLGAKIRAYGLQEEGLDTVEANAALGFGADLRDYGIAAQILRALGAAEVSLLTNNPRKSEGLRACGVQVRDEVPLLIPANPHNAAYLAAKRDKLGHRIPRVGAEAGVA
jgi:3,4-dihydroxy 2-butanone 4-phosphate synthase/GTP cyclohydrolase II